MFCPRCAAQTSGDALFCGSCGSQVREGPSVPPPTPFAVDFRSLARGAEWRSIASGSLVIVVLVVLGAAAGWMAKEGWVPYALLSMAAGGVATVYRSSTRSVRDAAIAGCIGGLASVLLLASGLTALLVTNAVLGAAMAALGGYAQTRLGGMHPR